MATQAARDIVRKGVDMLRVLIGIMGRTSAQQSALTNVTTPWAVDTKGSANVSPTFEAWLQAYRRRLEQACAGPNARHISGKSAVDAGSIQWRCL
jgi:hypothetical protein